MANARLNGMFLAEGQEKLTGKVLNDVTKRRALHHKDGVSNSTDPYIVCATGPDLAGDLEIVLSRTYDSFYIDDGLILVWTAQKRKQADLLFRALTSHPKTSCWLIVDRVQ